MDERDKSSVACFDCGSPVARHHTAMCELAGLSPIRDLPQITDTQYWDESAEQPNSILRFKEKKRIATK